MICEHAPLDTGLTVEGERLKRQQRLEEIRARAAAATPGPWGWFGNTDVHTFYLATKHSGRQYVMDFCRFGMRGAQPVFQDDDGMKAAKDIAIYAVKPTAIDRKDPDVYRADIIGFRNPDAEFIAEARADVDYLLRVIDRLIEGVSVEKLIGATP